MHPYHHSLFVNFIVYFNCNQDYFECHEVLEEYWKSIPNRDKNHPLTTYILLSTGMYHWRRNNLNGAIRTLEKAMVKLPVFEVDTPAFTEEIDFHQLLHDLGNAISRLKQQLPFESFPILIKSSTLTNLVLKAEQSMDLLPFGDDAVIHKHMLRDRSDILREREEKKKGRH